MRLIETLIKNVKNEYNLTESKEELYTDDLFSWKILLIGEDENLKFYFLFNEQTSRFKFSACYPDIPLFSELQFTKEFVCFFKTEIYWEQIKLSIDKMIFKLNSIVAIDKILSKYTKAINGDKYLYYKVDKSELELEEEFALEGLNITYQSDLKRFAIKL